MDEVPMALVNPSVGHFETLSVSRERSLVDRAREMDATAWDELYTLHYGAIQRYAMFRLSDPVAAEDIAAEVFLEAVRGIGKYRYRGVAFRAWLYRIAHNLTADFRHRLAVRTEQETEDTALDALSTDDFAPSLERKRDLQTAVALLTDEQQQVVILRYFEGLSLAETAEATGRKSGAIKSLQHRALERLRAILGEVP